ncbi:MAG: SNF2 helicase-associated domain-containing protein, partial [Pseudonocardiaceae bacterium]
MQLPDRLQATFWPGGRVPADGHLALWGTDDPAAAAVAVGLPGGQPAQLPTVLPRTQRARRVVPADVPARVVPVRSAARALAALPPPQDWPAWHRPGDALLAWSVAAKLALELVAGGHLVPAVRPAGPGVGIAHWRIAPADDGRLAALAAAFPPSAHALRRDEDDELVWSPDELLAAFCDAVADSCARGGVPSRGWVGALTGENPIVELAGDVDDPLAEELARWSAPLVRRDGAAAARLCLQLHTPGGIEPDAPWPLAYHLQAADDPSLLVAAEQVWDTGTASLRVLGRRVGDPQESLVRGLAEAARLFPPIDASLSEPRPVGLDLDPRGAADFLTEGAQALAASGLGVLLPAELTAQGARKLRARLRLGTPVTDPGAGITAGGLDADNLAGFRWEAA